MALIKTGNFFVMINILEFDFYTIELLGFLLLIMFNLVISYQLQNDNVHRRQEFFHRLH